MTKEQIIQGLQFTIDMFLFDPNTGKTFKEPRNDMDKITVDSCREAIKALEIKPIGYRECSDAMLKMWMDNVLTDGEYYRIMDKLNAKWSKMNEVKS